MEYPEYYKILELPLSADTAEIKRQFRKMAKKYHPDLHTGDKQAEEMFKKLKEAYEVLSDENKRAAYDLDWKKQREKEQKQRKKQEKENTKEAPKPATKNHKPATKTEPKKTTKNPSNKKSKKH